MKTAEQEALETHIVIVAAAWHECEERRARSNKNKQIAFDAGTTTDVAVLYEVSICARRAELESLEAESQLFQLTGRLLRLRAEQEARVAAERKP